MIDFTGTRDRTRYAAAGRTATMRGIRTPPRVSMSELDQVEPSRHHGDFWSQVPVVLFTVAAVVALFVVNGRTQAAPSAPVVAPSPAAVEVKVTPVGCTDCGEIIAIRHLSAEDGATEGKEEVLLDVRMTDGSVRTVKQFATGFDIGDQVQVNGNALISRG